MGHWTPRVIEGAQPNIWSSLTPFHANMLYTKVVNALGDRQLTMESLTPPMQELIQSLSNHSTRMDHRGVLSGGVFRFEGGTPYIDQTCNPFLETSDPSFGQDMANLANAPETIKNAKQGTPANRLVAGVLETEIAQLFSPRTR